MRGSESRGGAPPGYSTVLGLGANTANAVTPPVPCPITGLPAAYERLRLTFLPFLHTKSGVEAA
jgi:hypothetical protein